MVLFRCISMKEDGWISTCIYIIKRPTVNYTKLKNKI